jgi:hypothetical protein
MMRSSGLIGCIYKMMGMREIGVSASSYIVWEAGCDNPPRKIPYYRLNQSTLVIKQ